MMFLFSKSIGEIEIEFTGENPKTAAKILSSLPIESRAMRWGMEIYFSIGVQIELENGRTQVEVGDVAYWPPGKAICIFFGQTPASINDKPRAVSPVNVFGRTSARPELLDKVKEGELIRLYVKP